MSSPEVTIDPPNSAVARVVWGIVWRGVLLSLICGFIFGLGGALVGAVAGIDPNTGGKYASYLGSMVGYIIAVFLVIGEKFGEYHLKLVKIST